VEAKLYGIPLSHPVIAVRLMLGRKGIGYRMVEFPAGWQPLLVRAAGFPGQTVPALELDGHKLQGSRAIAQGLDEAHPDPPLFPQKPAHRRAVEDAERWGEEELQPVPRRLFRWQLAHDAELRRWFAAEIVGMPAVAAPTLIPVAHLFMRLGDIDDARIQADLAGLPALLDRADELIAAGTIGADEPNAGDFQIGTTVRVLLAFPGTAPLAEGRPIGELARRLVPDYPGPIPPALPREWLPATA
jgi:glutathione S-transferase